MNAKPFLFKSSFIAAAVFAICFQNVYAQQLPPWPEKTHIEMGGEWRPATDNSGKSAIEIYFEYGAVRRHVTIPIPPSGMPQSGRVRFPNGFERDLTLGELDYFWNEVGGSVAASKIK